VSIIPARCITTEDIFPSTQRLSAANGSEIGVLGEATVNIELEPGFAVTTRFLVSDYVEEIALGLDWLTEQNVNWNFGQHTIAVRGRRYKLFSAKPTLQVRRVVLEQEVVNQK